MTQSDMGARDWMIVGSTIILVVVLFWAFGLLW